MAGSVDRWRSRFQGSAKSLADPRDFRGVYRDLAGGSAALLIEERPALGLIVCVPRHHMAVQMRMTLAQGRRVDAQGAGDLFQRALEVPQGHTKVRRLAIIEMGRSRDVPLADEHHPARDAVRRIHMAHVPELVLKDGRLSLRAGERLANAAPSHHRDDFARLLKSRQSLTQPSNARFVLTTDSRTCTNPRYSRPLIRTVVTPLRATARACWAGSMRHIRRPGRALM